MKTSRMVQEPRTLLGSRLSDISEDETSEMRKREIRERSKLLWEIFKAKLDEVITLKYMINLVFILTICFVCFQQCYLQISEYLEYKTLIQVTHSPPINTVFLVPGITICNNNRLRLDKIAEDVPAIKDDVDKVLRETTAVSLTDKRRMDLMRSIKTAIDEFANITKIIVESPISKLMKMSRSNMIEDINCNTSWGRQINCENIKIIESFQGGPCYTAFYLGAFLEALSTGRAYDFNSSLLTTGAKKLTSFDSHEVAEILVNFGPLQHGDVHQDIGGKLAIHSTGHVGSIRDVAHTILPGYKYEVIIQRYMSKRLPPPYESMCYDYKYFNSPKQIRDQDVRGTIELDKTTCTRNCIIQKTTKACNCWPIEIPFYPNDNTVENAGSYRMCSWGFDEANLGNFSSRLYVDCYRKFHDECRDKCRPGCRTEDYRVHIISNSWPERKKFMLANSATELQKLTKLKGSFACISIKYSDFIERRHIMIPNLTLAQMVSNIGGIVSALIGVSTITIYRYVTRRVFHCQVASDHVPLDLLAPVVKANSTRGSRGRRSWPVKLERPVSDSSTAVAMVSPA